MNCGRRDNVLQQSLLKLCGSSIIPKCLPEYRKSNILQISIWERPKTQDLFRTPGYNESKIYKAENVVQAVSCLQ